MIWEYDELKNNTLKKLKEYSIRVVWEKDYRDDKGSTVQKCLEFLQHE
jgi:hypothetical protein